MGSADETIGTLELSLLGILLPAASLMIVMVVLGILLPAASLMIVMCIFPEGVVQQTQPDITLVS